MTRKRKISLGLMLTLIAVVSYGCLERSLQPVNPCTRSRVGETIQVTSVDEVDLLFMVDNSNSMSEEQVALTREFPRLVRVLASGDSTNPPDGVRDFQPVRSLHVGVVTSDMGTGGFTTATCGNGTAGFMFGDDGILRTQGRTAIPGCMASYPAIFDFVRDSTDPDAYATDVSCVATVGTGGCGFEQQLDATLKALSPSTAQAWTRAGYEPPLFFASTFGHADGMNAGFIRPNSALAIILVTDEEDCSVTDPDLFNTSSARYSSVDLNLRCFSFPDVLYPVERYVNGFLQLRQNPNLLIFAAIVGVPVETVGMPYATVLEHPDMVEMIDPATPTRLRPSCNRGGNIAFPPRRIVRVAAGLEAGGAATTVQSICQDNFSGALDEIIEKIAAALGGACLPRELSTDATGLVSCQVFELLPATGDFTSCAMLPGRSSVGTEIVGGVTRELCQLDQVGPAGFMAGTPGWWYETAEDGLDPSSTIAMTCGSDGQRIRFTADPVTNSEVRLECLQTILGSGGTGTVQLGSFCDPEGATTGCEGTITLGGAPVSLSCDPFDRTCQVPCGGGGTGACVSAGLLSHVCDSRSWAEALGVDEPGISAEERARRVARVPGGEGGLTSPHNFCVNPTCF